MAAFRLALYEHLLTILDYLKVTNARRTVQLNGLLCMLYNLHQRTRRMQCASLCYSLARPAHGRRCGNSTDGSLVGAQLVLDISPSRCTTGSLLMNHCHDLSSSMVSNV